MTQIGHTGVSGGASGALRMFTQVSKSEVGLLRRHRRPKPRWLDAPLEVASGVWRPIVEPKPGQVDHPAYTLCVLERLRDSLRKRDVFVKASRRWRDPRAQLLAGDEWEAARSGVCRSLGRSADGEAEPTLLREELDLA